MRRILLVDDSPSVRRALEDHLEPFGFEIEHAENGAVAGARLKRAPFDLVFLDLHMPVLDGISLLRLMRAQGIATRVVLVTAGAATPVVADAVRLGASDYVAKPFDAAQIRRVLQSALALPEDALRPHEARLLVQHPDPGLAPAVQAHLPPHVQVDACATLDEALALAGRRPPGLVLLDAGARPGDAAAAAGAVRGRVPVAGIFGVTRGRAPALPWSPDGPIDGVVGPPLDEPLVRGFLYGHFLRPIASVDGETVHAAGPPRTPVLPAYFRQLGRVLADHAAALAEQVQDVTVDLGHAPRDVGELALLVRIVRGRVEEVGGSVTFAVAPDVVAELARRPEAANALFVASGS